MCGWFYKTFIECCRSNGGSSSVQSATGSRRGAVLGADVSLTRVERDQVPKVETGQVLVIVPASDPVNYHNHTTMTASASASQITPLPATSGPTTRRSAWVS